MPKHHKTSPDLISIYNLMMEGYEAPGSFFKMYELLLGLTDEQLEKLSEMIYKHLQQKENQR